MRLLDEVLPRIAESRDVQGHAVVEDDLELRLEKVLGKTAAASARTRGRHCFGDALIRRRLSRRPLLLRLLLALRLDEPLPLHERVARGDDLGWNERTLASLLELADVLGDARRKKRVHA